MFFNFCHVALKLHGLQSGLLCQHLQQQLQYQLTALCLSISIDCFVLQPLWQFPQPSESWCVRVRVCDVGLQAAVPVWFAPAGLYLRNVDGWWELSLCTAWCRPGAACFQQTPPAWGSLCCGQTQMRHIVHLHKHSDYVMHNELLLNNILYIYFTGCWV